MCKFADSVILAVAVLGVAGRSQAEPDKPLNVPHVFSVDGPGGGYEWIKVGDINAQDTAGAVYSCGKEGSTSRIVLTVIRRVLVGDKGRIATLKAQYNGLAQGLQKKGLKDIKGKQPALNSPIPNRVTYTMSGSAPDGLIIFISAETVFGANVYSFQSMARTAKDADAMLKVAETLKEDPDAEAFQTRVHDELAKIQGTWRQVSAVANGSKLPDESIRDVRVMFKGNKKDVRIENDLVAADVLVELDPTTNPMIWDETPHLEGQEPTTFRGIYKIDGDTLTRCVAPPEEDRPTEFASKPKSGHTLQVFERVKVDNPRPKE